MGKRFKTTVSMLGFLFLIGSEGQSAPVTIEVDSLVNSVQTGIGKATGINLTSGQAFSVTADPLDTWSLGSNQPSSRESNADGLPFYGSFSFGGFSTLFGTLAGRIGSGNFFAIGTSFNGTASSTGELLLYNWDTFNGDNSGSILANVTVPNGTSDVPVPAAAVLFGSALAGLGLVRNRRKVAS